VDFALSFLIILFDIFLAKEKDEFGISFVLLTCFFGIIITCPFEIGFISKTAMFSLFSSIFFEGISPSTTDLKMSFFDFGDFCCFSISSSARDDKDSICFNAACFCCSGRFCTCETNCDLSCFICSGVNVILRTGRWGL